MNKNPIYDKHFLFVAFCSKKNPIFFHSHATEFSVVLSDFTTKIRYYFVVCFTGSCCTTVLFGDLCMF